MLTEKYSKEMLKSSLVDSWHPYPDAADRGSWEALPDPMRKAYVARGEEALSFDWPTLPATLFLDHVRTGNRSRYQNERNKRRTALGHLVLAGV